MGYAPHADIAAAGILRLAENLPVVVDIVDEAERIEAFMPFLKSAVRTGIVLSSRPLRFHADLPAVVEALGLRQEIEAALQGVRRVFSRGLITLTEVDLYEPD